MNALVNKTLKPLIHSASVLVLATALAVPGYAADATPSVEGARAYIISPANGETVPQTFTVKFGLTGMGVAPAGVDKPKTGHHHLLVDKNNLPPMNKAMAQDVIHFGGGQTEAKVTLEPGKHTLQLILGDRHHVPHDPAVVSEKITVYVEK